MFCLRGLAVGVRLGDVGGFPRLGRVVGGLFPVPRFQPVPRVPVLGFLSGVPVAAAPRLNPLTRVAVFGLFSRVPVASAPRYKEGGPSFLRGFVTAGLLLSAGWVVAPRDTRVHMAPKPKPRGPNLSEEAKISPPWAPK